MALYLWEAVTVCAGFLSAITASPALPQKSATNSTQCSLSQFSDLSIPDGAILNLLAIPVRNYAASNTTLDFCNVTVTYTHPSWNDTIHTTIYLPDQTWNGRFQAVGGGGWAGSFGPDSLLSPISKGYAAGTTDAGHERNILSSEDWYRDSSGEVNINLLIDFASVALNEMGLIGKQVSRLFYGKAPHHSYWSGCSTGGRQGLMMAQRYPSTFDGIYAGAPAINWDRFIVAEYWPQFVMHQIGHYPAPCALDAITAAIVAECDEIDGVADGVISAVDECQFDPSSVVGRSVGCGEQTVSISKLDAEVVRQAWKGPHASNGTQLWYGLGKGANLTGTSLVNTTCTSPTNCTPLPFEISVDYITRWVLQDADFDLIKISLDDFTSIFRSSMQQYQDIIGTSNPDLSAFKAAGGKMLTWHGLADELIFPKGTEDYYSRVEKLDPSVRDFYRFYEAPGVGHCDFGGLGEIPVDPLETVVSWVENGTEPDTLYSKSTDGKRERGLCMWPKVSVFKGGDPARAESFECQEHW